MSDEIQIEHPEPHTEEGHEAVRRHFELDDRGFDEVPAEYRRFYRWLEGPEDSLGPNEAFCPICRVVIRSTWELRPGDRLYCMACMSRLTVESGEEGRLETRLVY